jgi:hypothetical protein
MNKQILKYINALAFGYTVCLILQWAKTSGKKTYLVITIQQVEEEDSSTPQQKLGKFRK